MFVHVYLNIYSSSAVQCLCRGMLLENASKSSEKCMHNLLNMYCIMRFIVFIVHLSLYYPLPAPLVPFSFGPFLCRLFSPSIRVSPNAIIISVLIMFVIWSRCYLYYYCSHCVHLFECLEFQMDAINLYTK